MQNVEIHLNGKDQPDQVTKETLIHGQLTFMALNDCRLCDSDFKCIAEKLLEGRLPNQQYLYLHNPIDAENLTKPSYWSKSASSSMQNTLKEAVAKHEERNGVLRDVLYPPVFLNDETPFKTDWLNLSEEEDLYSKWKTTDRFPQRRKYFVRKKDDIYVWFTMEKNESNSLLNSKVKLK